MKCIDLVAIYNDGCARSTSLCCVHDTSEAPRLLGVRARCLGTHGSAKPSTSTEGIGDAVLLFSTKVSSLEFAPRCTDSGWTIGALLNVYICSPSKSRVANRVLILVSGSIGRHAAGGVLRTSPDGRIALKTVPRAGWVLGPKSDREVPCVMGVMSDLFPSPSRALHASDTVFSPSQFP